ncbi:MAG: protein adenylyltransferase SelO [Rickettsiales bacterium]
MTLRNQIGWHFDNSYSRLSNELFVSQLPEPVRAPRLLILNELLADTLGLDPSKLSDEAGVNVFAGNSTPQGANPIAQAYAGHQFGGFTMLGDGRAVLLGEHIAPDGRRFDIQLKGSGKTVFSRRGDGRAAVGPMLREYIISEAMHALGIPTTRSLAVIATGEPVVRETLLPGAVLTRVAASHIRVGTFEYVASQQNIPLLRELADYSIARHYGELGQHGNVYQAFLQSFMERQAALLAQWQAVGFIHGVMNTDNMAISGETIDYGPCAFMDTYDPMTVFSSIDRHGRYAYANQPLIAQWNIARFAEAILPLLHSDQEKAIDIASEAIDQFSAMFNRSYLLDMRKKVGLSTEESDDEGLINSLLTLMHEQRVDYTNTFRALSTDSVSQVTYPAFAAWHSRWQARLLRQESTKEEVLQLMLRHNPALIPRNHRVEEALEAAVEREDLLPLHDLLAALRDPYAGHDRDTRYQSTPPANLPPYKTYCGT